MCSACVNADNTFNNPRFATNRGWNGVWMLWKVKMIKKPKVSQSYEEKLDIKEMPWWRVLTALIMMFYFTTTAKNDAVFLIYCLSWKK